MLDDLLKESSTIQAFYEEGREEGLAEGGRQMAREMARLALEGRFGTLPQEVLAAITTADEATLRAIIGQIATISLDEVRKQLGAV